MVTSLIASWQEALDWNPDVALFSPGLGQLAHHFYSRGINLRALGALIPSAGISLVFAFAPSLKPFSAFSWFIAAGLGAVIYFVVADRSRSYQDVSGEAIAVESNH